MTTSEAEEICEKLKAIIENGPGDNPSMLNQVTVLLASIERDERYNAYVREKILAVRESFGEWFSARRWNKNGDGGSGTKQWLYTDLRKLEGACSTVFRDKTPNAY